jgi:putative ABC transport system permease protein
MELGSILGREIRHALRTLKRAPAFSLITVLTFGLGIGAATAIFTLLDAVVLSPLPYPHADRLVRLTSPVPLMKGQTEWGLARHEMFFFLGQGHTLDAMGVYQTGDVTVIGTDVGQRSERARMATTSASLFDVLGFSTSIGQLFTAADNHQREASTIVLSHAYSLRHFGGDVNVIGKTLDIEGFPMRILGVMRAGADLPDVTVDLWRPAWVDSTTNFNNHTWSAIGRLRPGVTVEQAGRELAGLTGRMAEVGFYPDVYRGDFIRKTGFTTRVTSLRDAVVGAMLTRALWTLFGAVGLVLLIATANVANLFLVRIDARAREMAMRTALGADRRQLATHYLAESFTLAGLSGILAVVVAAALLRTLLAVAPSDLPRLAEVRLSAASVAFAIGGALLAGIIFGVVPLVSRSLDLTALREGGRGMLSSRTRNNARRVLVATQMAFAVVLLASAVLMVRTFRNLRDVKPGFDPSHVVVMDIALPGSRYGRSPELASTFFETLVRELRAVPGVSQAGLTDRLPLLGGDWCTGIILEGPTSDAARGICPADALISPGYFEAMGIHVTGRFSDWSGMDGHDGSVIVSKAFADHYWPGENPIGKGVRFGGSKPPFYRVTGVAEDVRANGVDAPPVEMAYFPMLPVPGAPLWGSPTEMNLVIRAGVADPTALANMVGRLIRPLESQATIANAQSMSGVLAQSVAKQSFTMALLLVSAAMAMLLAGVGIYGVISYIVSQRRGEIGVRMALGARVSDVTTMVLRQSVSIAAFGIIIGVGGSWATTRLLRTLLFGVQPTDPTTMVAVPAALLAVVILAALAPARRAARIDPVEALR